jgi:RNA polymerase sigma factor (sigma-70 family)
MKLFGNSSKQMNDEDLIVRYRKTGNAAVLGTIFNRYARLVYGLCLKYMKKPANAEDETMAIFEKLITDLQKHNIVCFKAWLYTYAKNHCLMELRKIKPKMVEFSNEFHQQMIDPDPFIKQEQETENERTHSTLRFIFSFLNTEQQICLSEFYNNNKSYKDVSLQTGLSLKQVKSHIQNGKRNLRIRFEKFNSKQEDDENI